MSDDLEQTRREVKMHLRIGAMLALLILTSIGIAMLPIGAVWHLLIGLGIATLMAGLVLLYFMHFKGEQKLIYQIMIATAVMFAALIFLSLLAYWDYAGKAVVEKF